MTPLHVTSAGTGTPRVVFLHGLLGQGKNWAGIAKSLGTGPQGPDFPGLLVDLPNHGRSPWTSDLSYPALADAVAADLAARLTEPVCLVGHSMGGKVAMALALRHPELLRSLVVVDISPVAAGEGYGFGHFVAAMRALDLGALGDRSDADAALAPAVPDAGVRAFLLQNLHRSGRDWRWLPNLALLADRMDAVGSWPADLGGSFDAPTLWIRGARSDYVTAEHGPAMRALFPRARLVTVKDAGHWVHADRPDAVTAVLRAFLTENTSLTEAAG